MTYINVFSLTDSPVTRVTVRSREQCLNYRTVRTYLECVSVKTMLSETSVTLAGTRLSTSPLITTTDVLVCFI